MPADELFDLQETILAAIKEQVKAYELERGVMAPTPMLPQPTNVFEALATYGNAPVNMFATGYNSGTGTSTIAFTTDLSILYASGSGDILTG